MKTRITVRAVLLLSLLGAIVGCGDRSEPDADRKAAGPKAGAPEHGAAIQPLPRGNSGLIPTQPGFTAFDAAVLKIAPSTRLCSVGVVNGQRPPMATTTVGKTGNIRVEGWVLNPKRQSPAEFAILLVGDTSAFALQAKTGVKRPDVARVFKSPDAAVSGFSVTAPLGAVASGTYSVRLLQDSSNEVSVCTTPFKIAISD